jgi:hypothetical protein
MQSIGLFLIIALVTFTNSANLQSGNKIKSTTQVQTMTSSEQAIYTSMWKTLFKVPRGTACSKNNILSRVRRELKDDGKYPSKHGRAQKNKFWWVKQWGYEASAYFFDYLDPILRDLAVKEFQAIVTALKAFPQADSKIPDPFDFKKMISKGNANFSAKQMKTLKKFTQNYDAKTYEASANLPQVQAAINKWKWAVNPGDPTYFQRFIQKYDMNYDGRLNPREFVLASLYNNKQTVGSSLCDHCFFEVGKTLDAIFLYLDCDNDGLLSAEEIWGNLPNIKRSTEKWNMFAFGNDQSIRTAAINDFVLKNSKIKEGFITRVEFRVGLLLGLWDRQTETTKVVTDDSRTMKNLRWKEGDMIDVALYNYYKKKMMSGLVK